MFQRELSFEEKQVFRKAGRRVNFIVGATAFSGFIAGAFPFFLMRKGRWRLKAAFCGSLGFFTFAFVLSPFLFTVPFFVVSDLAIPQS